MIGGYGLMALAGVYMRRSRAVAAIALRLGKWKLLRSNANRDEITRTEYKWITLKLGRIPYFFCTACVLLCASGATQVKMFKIPRQISLGSARFLQIETLFRLRSQEANPKFQKSDTSTTEKRKGTGTCALLPSPVFLLPS